MIGNPIGVDLLDDGEVDGDVSGDEPVLEAKDIVMRNICFDAWAEKSPPGARRAVY
jgi:hypothetical protein